MGFDDDTAAFTVVLNEEGQYSIWPQDKAVPPGWQDSGRSGTKAACLQYIEEAWRDMRPLSLRNFLAQQDAGRPA
jgi:MbtH protein